MKKIFKKLILSGALILSPTFILSSCGGGETITPTPQPEEEKFTIETSFDKTKGNVVLDKKDGKVGETVTATITAKEGFEVTEIKFNSKTLEFAPTLSLTPKKGENVLSVTFDKAKNPTSDPVVEKELIVSGNYKTEYIVGEALTFNGLEVKLFTTTDGVKDEGVAYTTYQTSLEEGYVFTNEDITVAGDTLDLIISSEDETITSATIELTVKRKPVVEVGITPADFLKRMKTIGKYTVESAETKGVFIPNANYWTGKTSGYETYGFAQNSERIIVYNIVGDRINEKESFKYTDTYKAENSSGEYEEHTYTGMYDDEFANYLRNTNESYSIRGIDFISDEEIEEYRKLKPQVDNPNKFIFSIPNDRVTATKTDYAKDIFQLTFNGELPLNDYGLAVTIGSNAKIQMTVVSENEMKIEIINGTSVRYWPIETVIKIDESLDIPEIQPFLKNETVVDPNLERAKTGFDALRGGNFTTESGDVYNENYLYRKSENSAIYSASGEFDFDGAHFYKGNYKVQFNAQNVATKDSLTQLEVGAYNPISINEMLNKDAEYLPYFNEANNSLTLSFYAKSDSIEYYSGIPSLYMHLFNISAESEENTRFDNLNFEIYFKDTECKVVNYIDVKFGRQIGDNKTIKLSDFGTSKVDHVETFVNSIK